MRTLLALLFTCSLSAQNFVSFPDSGAVWVNANYNLRFPDPSRPPLYNLNLSVKFCVDGEDTLINSSQYTKVSICAPNQRYFGAIRDSLGLISFVPKDSSEALKLYDFNLQLGDTLKDFYSIAPFNYDPSFPVFELLGPNFSGSSLVVSQVDTLYSSRGMHRVIYPEYSSPWIEGVGNIQGLFWDPFPNISNFTIRLECHSVGDSVYYGINGLQSSSGPCDLTFATVDRASPELKPFPNPSGGPLQFNNAEPQSLRVYESSGKLILERALAPFEALDLSVLPPGVYWLKLGRQGATWVKQ